MFNTTVLKALVAKQYNYNSRDSGRVFSKRWYKRRYGRHFWALYYHLKKGEQVGHNPSLAFDTEWYRARYLEGDKSRSPLLHYLLNRMSVQTHPAYFPYSSAPIHKNIVALTDLLNNMDTPLNQAEKERIYKLIEKYSVPSLPMGSPFLSNYARLKKTRGPDIALDLSEVSSPESYAAAYNSKLTYLEKSLPAQIEAPLASFNAEKGLAPKGYAREGNQPYLLEVKDVFVPSGFSLFFNNESVYFESGHHTQGNPDSITITPQPPHDKKCTQAVLSSRVRCYDKVIIGTYNMDFNYYHWLVEGLPRIKMALDCKQYNDYSILVTENLHGNCYEALAKIADGRKIVAVPERSLAYIKNGVYPSEVNAHYKSAQGIPKISDFPTNMDYLRNCVTAIINNVPEDNSLPKRVFFQRRYRVLQNQFEINKMFIRNGFEIIYPEDLSFSEQVQYCRNAEVFASVGGSGAANMLFCRPGTPVCIFSHFGVYGSVRTWQMLAHVSRASLCCLFGEKSNKADYMQIIDDDFVVDPKYVEEFFGLIQVAG